MKTSIVKAQVDGMPGAISGLGPGAAQEIAERRTCFLAGTGLGLE